MAGKSRPPTASELELWRLVTQGAEPLRGNRRPAVAVAPAPSPPPAAAPAGPPASGRGPGPVAAPALAAPGMAERMAWLMNGVRQAARPAITVSLRPEPLGARGGIDRRTEEKLRGGRLSIDGRIDLHGMTRAEAHAALAAFIRSSHGAGRRLLLVITGKGSPSRGEGVLRVDVPRWLREPGLDPLVLAVHQARPQHGGGGALYVLLRRRR